MESLSLGLVETVGYVTAIEAADAGSKAANVRMLGYESARAGLITVKFAGDVAAVRAAVNAATVAAERVGKVVAVHVIARPDRQLHIAPEDVGSQRSKAQPAVAPTVELAQVAEELDEVAPTEANSAMDLPEERNSAATEVQPDEIVGDGSGIDVAAGGTNTEGDSNSEVAEPSVVDSPIEAAPVAVKPTEKHKAEAPEVKEKAAAGKGDDGRSMTAGASAGSRKEKAHKGKGKRKF